MKTKFFALAIVVCSSFSIVSAQSYLDKMADEVCTCMDNLDPNLSKDDLTIQLGLCLMQSAQPYTKELKKNNGIDFTKNAGKAGRKLGELVGLQMVSYCPGYLIAISGSGSSSFKEEQVKRKSLKKTESGVEVAKEKKEAIVESKTTLEGKVVALKKGQFYTVSFTDKEGKTHKLLWLEYFKNADKLLNDLETTKTKEIEIEYEEKELYNIELDQYIKTKVITSLSFV